MNILLMGDEPRIEEIQKKFQLLSRTDLTFSINNSSNLKSFDLIIDLMIGEKNSLDLSELYVGLSKKVVIVGAVKQSLAALAKQMVNPIDCHLIGINNLPTFVNRSLWELSAFNTPAKLAANKLLGDLGINRQWVQDRVGMVTPRVILMIINEAFYALQEGTATKKDIDLAMKLGTRYPYGPFEWAELIGIRHVYEMLEALYQDTHDERYRVCPLLKTTYFQLWSPPSVVRS